MRTICSIHIQKTNEEESVATVMCINLNRLIQSSIAFVIQWYDASNPKQKFRPYIHEHVRIHELVFTMKGYIRIGRPFGYNQMAGRLYNVLYYVCIQI